MIADIIKALKIFVLTNFVNKTFLKFKAMTQNELYQKARTEKFGDWLTDSNPSNMCETVFLWRFIEGEKLNLQSSKMFLVEIINLIGCGFHLDTNPKEYINVNDKKPTLQLQEAQYIEWNIEQAFEAFEAAELDIYEFCSDVVYTLFDFPPQENKSR